MTGGIDPAGAPPSSAATASPGSPPLAPALPGSPAYRPLRRRVVWLLGTLLVIGNAYFGTYAYVVTQALIWTQTSLLRGPVVVLFLLVGANAAVARLARRAAMSQAELLILYGMLCVSTCAAGYGFVQMLVNQMAAPFYFASGSNGWREKIWPHIAPWLAPRDESVIKGFYRGQASLYQPHVLAAWAVPVAAWTAFIFGIFWVLMCATALLRRQWVEEERLTFPLVHLPLQMTERGSAQPFWRSRLMWAGFLVAGALESVNFVSYLYPAVPSIPIKPIGVNQIDVFFTQAPWNAVGMLRLAFYPFVIGIGYLLSLEVSFSCWFFYLCVKAANIGSAAMGFSEAGGAGMANRAPYVREQAVGAFVGIAIFSAWMARRALARAWREALRPATGDGPAAEMMSPRLALFGGAGALVFLVLFLNAAGLEVPLAALLVFVYFCFALTLARIVSEAGAGWAWAPAWSPTAFTSDTFGADHLSPKTLTVLHGYTAWLSDMRDNPMPQQMQTMRLAQSGRLSPRAFLWPLAWAALFGTLCAFWAHLHIYYTFGAATAKVRPYLASVGPSQFNQVASLISAPTPRDVPGLVGAAFGLVAALSLSRLRLQFSWWPLHPLGYALAATPSMDYMWFPFLLAWLAKLVTVRYGGIRAYRTALPFFLGLILGDYVVPAAWGVYGMLTGQQQYMVFPH